MNCPFAAHLGDPDTLLIEPAFCAGMGQTAGLRGDLGCHSSNRCQQVPVRLQVVLRRTPSSMGSGPK